MIIRTSRYCYREADRFDITAKSKDPLGRLFSPPWSLVMDYKRGFEGETSYTQKYLDLIEDRFARQAEEFKKLRERDRLVLVCFCKETDFCHRFLVANWLEDRGFGKYKGEIRL